MFDKKITPLPQPAPEEGQVHTIVGKESKFNGKLSFEGTVRIDGKFTGEIFSKGKLILGDSAQLNAEVEVNTFISSGEVKGNVTARSRIELKAPGKLRGNIKTPVLVVDEGVLLEGSCQMENLEKPLAASQKDKTISILKKEGKETEAK